MKWCDRDLAYSPYRYGLCMSEADFEKELKRLKIHPREWPPFVDSTHANATCHLFEQPDGLGRAAIICLRLTKKHTTEEVYALLVHEAMHLWREIIEAIGERRPSSEFEAYSMQAICLNLFEAYKEAKK